MHVLQRHAGQIAIVAQGVPAAAGVQKLAPVDDVGPVISTGVGHGHQHLAMRRQCRDGFQRLVRDVRGAEEHDAPRQRMQSRQVGGSGCRTQGLQEPLMQHGAGGRLLGRRQAIQGRAPQRRLPALILRHRRRAASGTCRRGPDHVASSGPVLQPVAAVDLILVEQVGQALRQLQAPGRVMVAEKAGHGLEAGLAREPRQQTHEPPGQRQFVERRHLRHRSAAEHGTIGAPDEARRQLDARGRAHTVGRRDFHLQPLGHAVALDEEDLFLQRAQRVLGHPGQHRLGQVLEAIAVQDQQPGVEFGRHVEWVSLPAA